MWKAIVFAVVFAAVVFFATQWNSNDSFEKGLKSFTALFRPVLYPFYHWPETS